MWDLNKAETGRRDGGGGGERPSIDWVGIAEPVARVLLGDPDRHLSSRRELRWGSRGSISLNLRTGQWFDHEQDEGGGVLALVERVLRCDRAGAMEWLQQQDYIEGLDPSRTITDEDRQRWEAQRAERERQNAERESIQDEETARKRALAVRQWHEAGPVDGTPALTYLRQVRKIDRWPSDAARYAPAFGASLWDRNPRPAVLFPITNDAGEIVAVQAVRLTHDGQKITDERSKTTLGPVGTGFLRLPGSGPLHVAEGPETGLSVWLATGAPVLVCCGAISARRIDALPVLSGDIVVIAGDASEAGSGVEKILARAAEAGAARGLDMRLAVPDGDAKRDWNDVLKEEGAEAVRAALAAAKRVEAAPVRDERGRFTGAGAVPMPPATPQLFLGRPEAEEAIADAVRAWLGDVRQWNEDREGTAPALAIAAAPGAGKSVAAQGILAAADLTGLPGDILWHAPTTRLLDEAATRLERTAERPHVTRGRSASNPATGEPMCARQELAEEVARAGLPVYPTLCERSAPRDPEAAKDAPPPEPIRCPHFASCAFRRQWEGLLEAPTLRFEASAYLNLPSDGSGRSVAARVADEGFLHNHARIADLSREEWLRPRRPQLFGPHAQRGEHAIVAAEIPVAAKAVWDALEHGRSPVRIGYTAEQFDAFAQAENPTLILPTNPSSSDNAILDELSAHKGLDPKAGHRAAVWRVLADCARRGIEFPERLRIVRDAKVPGSAETRDVLRVTWHLEPPRDVPLLILDADISSELLHRFYPEAKLIEVALQPNAEVVQVTDRTFSKGGLLGRPRTRAGVVALVRWEAYQDKLRGGSGTLAMATKAVVRQIFEDAGHDFTGKGAAEIDAVMRSTVLHGARWLWFGPALLGVNEYEDFTTTVVIGREELPLEALQDQARALFGDSGAPLDLIEEAPGANYPEALAGYTVVDGSGWGVMARMHPDPRVRALQVLYREKNTAQGLHRLRLNRAETPKRVVIASKVPIPGLPVTELVQWQELAPTRLQAAMAEAALRGGILRLSAAGLAADAPQAFATEVEAAHWLKRDGRGEVEAIKWGRTANETTITGVALFDPASFHLRLQGQRGKATPALAVLPGEVQAMVEAQIGPVAELRLLLQSAGDTAEPAPGGLQPALARSAQDGNAGVRRLNVVPLDVALPPRTPPPVPQPGSVEEDDELLVMPRMSIHGAEVLIFRPERPAERRSRERIERTIATAVVGNLALRIEPLDVDTLAVEPSRRLIHAALAGGARLLSDLRARVPRAVYSPPHWSAPNLKAAG